MTDAADNFQVTQYGPYIDFAAPGYQIYSTSTGSSYGAASGCSFAAPLVAGVMAWMLGENPTLAPDEVIGILTNTAVDLGPPGWDEYYGWGRIDFGAAAAAAAGTLPNVESIQYTNNTVTVSANYRPGLAYSLWRAPQLSPATWTLAANAPSATNGALVLLTDYSPPAAVSFYRVSASRPSF
jgi:subtilisin family serine protease